MPISSIRRHVVPWLLLLHLLVLVPWTLAAQTTVGGKVKEDEAVFKKADAPSSGSLGAALPPVERAINPETYYLGPTDQLLLSIPIIEQGEFPIVISMDNTVLIPRGLGLVNVEGVTLARFRRIIDSLFRARSANLKNVAVSLVKPRLIFVTVSGDVAVPRRYVLSAANRVTTAIDAANTIGEDLPLTQADALINQRKIAADDRAAAGTLGGLSSNQSLQRFVTLRHNDGSTREIDLLRYRAMGRDEDNPTLREGDEVIVRRADPADPIVAVIGAVNAPTVMAYRKGDNALMLTRLAGGFRTNASPSEAYISRYSGSGLVQIPVDFSDSASLASVDLAPGDQIFIPTISAESPVTGSPRSGAVRVVGEVGRPSTYPIISGVTRLSELIGTAGGLKQDASLNGAYINRASEPNFYRAIPQTATVGSILSTSSLPMDDTARYVLDVQNQKGRVSADFVEIFAKGNKSRDVVLQSGDEIVVPPAPRNVFIRGRVEHPGWVAYTPGTSLDYYLDQAGGVTAAAQMNRLEILKYGTGIWEKPDRTTIMAGDEIYVPGERDVPPRTSLETASTIISIVSGIASIANIIFYVVQSLRTK
ncbi:MAG: SLBB domain-containing protein [Candidatus Kapaibacterium sp.]